jgi:hypothetical protein
LEIDFQRSVEGELKGLVLFDAQEVRFQELRCERLHDADLSERRIWTASRIVGAKSCSRQEPPSAVIAISQKPSIRSARRPHRAISSKKILGRLIDFTVVLRPFR